MCTWSHAIRNRKVLSGPVQHCKIPAWHRRKYHFRQGSTHFRSQGCCNVCKMNQLENTTGNRSYWIWYAQPLQPSMMQMHHPMHAHWESKGLDIIVITLCLCGWAGKMRNWWEQSTETPQRNTSRTSKQPRGWEHGRQPFPTAVRGRARNQKPGFMSISWPCRAGQRSKSSPLETHQVDQMSHQRR